MADEIKDTEIDVLLAGKEVEIKGEKLQVKPYNWVNTLKMAKPFRTVLQAIFDNSERVSVLSNIDKMTGAQQMYAILDIVAGFDNSDEVIDALAELISASIGKDMDYVKDLDIDEVIELGIDVFTVNKDFFAQKMQKITKLVPQKEDLKKEK